MIELATHTDKLLRDEPLARYTAARMGGPADYVYVARKDSALDDMIAVAQAAWADNVPVRVIGGGANILVSDAGVRGLVVVNRITEIQFDDWHDGRTVSASSGTNLQILAKACAERGLSGMEWAVGVPGTVGGAAVNNAGAHGADMAASIADVVVLEAESGPQLYTNSDLAYDYRYSMLKGRQDRRFIVLLATFVLPYAERDHIKAKMAEFNAYRKRTQPPGASLGSIFKNPAGDYAGRLIESCGLKGYTVGGAQVSPIHANFFINTGGVAKASDYFALIRHVQAMVQAQTGVTLALEVETLGDWPQDS